MWPEINNRVNYPLKVAMVQLLDQDLLSMEDNTVKYCASQLLCEVSHVGVTRVVEAWNAHSIPGSQMHWFTVITLKYILGAFTAT